MRSSIFTNTVLMSISLYSRQPLRFEHDPFLERTFFLRLFFVASETRRASLGAKRLLPLANAFPNERTPFPLPPYRPSPTRSSYPTCRKDSDALITTLYQIVGTDFSSGYFWNDEDKEKWREKKEIKDLTRTADDKRNERDELDLNFQIRRSINVFNNSSRYVES